jgi:hypothetical protein
LKQEAGTEEDWLWETYVGMNPRERGLEIDGFKITVYLHHAL